MDVTSASNIYGLEAISAFNRLYDGSALPDEEPPQKKRRLSGEPQHVPQYGQDVESTDIESHQPCTPAAQSSNHNGQLVVEGRATVRSISDSQSSDINPTTSVLRTGAVVNPFTTSRQSFGSYQTPYKPLAAPLSVAGETHRERSVKAEALKDERATGLDNMRETTVKSIETLPPDIMTALHQMFSQDSRENADRAQAATDTPVAGGLLDIRLAVLPVLGKMSELVLQSVLGKGPEALLDPLRGSGAELRGHSILRSLFEQARSVYCERKFLKPTVLGDGIALNQQNVLRNANLATFVSELFNSQDPDLAQLDSNFLELFVPPGHSLLRWQAAIYLNLKTHAYIRSISGDIVVDSRNLDQTFPANLDSLLLARHSEREKLDPVEQEFVGYAARRKSVLQPAALGHESKESLQRKYDWREFLRDFLTCLNRNLVQSVKLTCGHVDVQPFTFLELYAPPQYGDQPIPDLDDDPLNLENEYSSTCHEDAIRKAALAAQAAFYGASSETVTAYTAGFPAVQDPPRTVTPVSLAEEAREAMTAAEDLSCQPSQSESTRVLYARARQVASSKVTASSRKAGVPSQRRPWTTEEENALMSGLDRVRGPHWSQILALYGPGGSISEVLKDRNQVQLKDKARNLKLFFLKSEIKVPYYLQSVTGELKTRAASQARHPEEDEDQDPDVVKRYGQSNVPAEAVSDDVEGYEPGVEQDPPDVANDGDIQRALAEAVKDAEAQRTLQEMHLLDPTANDRYDSASRGVVDSIETSNIHDSGQNDAVGRDHVVID